MRKNILGILAFVMAFVMIGGVSAACTITVNNPVTNQYYKDSVPFNWAQSSDCIGSNFDLYYKQGDCSLTPGASWTKFGENLGGTTSYSWQSGIQEGQYCLRVEEDNNQASATTSGLFYVDNINPTADANGDYICNEGSSVLLDASDSSDSGSYSSGIATYEWFVGGVSQGTNPSPTMTYNCLDGPVVETVSVKVTDNAGNSATDNSTITISNVNPVCNSIATDSGFWDSAVGFNVELTGTATDVPADTFSYSWNFGDGSSLVNGATVNHIYNLVGNHNVVLTVTDKDGGSCSMSHILNVVQPTVLPAQEVIAFHPFNYEFNSELTGTVTCTNLIPLPGHMVVNSNGNNCTITWDTTSGGNPANSEQGTHAMVIRVNDDGTNNKYYSVDTTVYSWIINLQEGWNLVSIPLVPSETTIDAVLGDVKSHVESIWSYEYDAKTDMSNWKCKKTTSSGSWSSSNCNSETTKLTTIIPGRGYWIKIKPGMGNVELKGFGQKAINPSSLPEIDTPYNHWILVGRYGIVGTTLGVFGNLAKATALNSMSSDPSKIALFDSSISWVENLDSQKGYWAFVSNPGLTDGTYAPTNAEYSSN